jgi:hypothetical protein
MFLNYLSDCHGLRLFLYKKEPILSEKKEGIKSKYRTVRQEQILLFSWLSEEALQILQEKIIVFFNSFIT